jgi:hypothetical protein
LTLLNTENTNFILNKKITSKKTLVLKISQEGYYTWLLKVIN